MSIMTTYNTTGNVTSPATLRDSVKSTVKSYLDAFDGQDPNDLHRLITDTVEESMLKFLVEYTRYNQSRIARILGLSRGATRKKLQEHEML